MKKQLKKLLGSFSMTFGAMTLASSLYITFIPNAEASSEAVDDKLNSYVKTSCDGDKACIIRTKAVLASFTGMLLHNDTRTEYFDDLRGVIEDNETRSCDRIIEKSGPGLEKGSNSENTAYMLMRLTRCKP